MKIKLLFTICLFFYSCTSHSLEDVHVPVDTMISLCSPYPTINDPTSFPKHFNSTNNLTRPIESGFYQAEGEIIQIYGRVMDGNCTPLNDAKIYIWQANSKGYIQYEIKTSNNRKHRQQWIDPNFAGNGITNSDNLGRFNFTTIKPGSSNQVTPHIHIMVMHPKLQTLFSKIYFIEDFSKNRRIIDTDIDDEVFIIDNEKFIRQVSAVKNQETGLYNIDITMEQSLSNKKY